HRAAVALREEDDPRGATGTLLLPDPIREKPLGRAPGDVDLANTTLPRHRAAESIGMIQALDRGLPPSTEVTARDRVIRVALDLGGPPGMSLHVDTAPGGTLPAGARIPSRDARDDFLRGDHVRDQPLDITRRTSRGGGTG